MSSEPTVACYAIRPGRTVLNFQKKFRGAADPPLDSVGIAQAHKLKTLFTGIDLSVIVCSDRKRAVQTAEIIAQGRDLPVQQSSCLRALDVGKFSGQDRSPENVAELQKYLDNPDCKIPEGESLNDFSSRIQPCIKEAVDMFLKCGIPPLIVGHSSIIRELGTMFKGQHSKVLVDPGGAVAIFIANGKLDADPIYKPMKAPTGKADTIS